MSNIEMVTVALQELGNVPDTEVASFLSTRFGMTIAPKFIPIYKASIRDKERHDKARQATKTAANGTVT